MSSTEAKEIVLLGKAELMLAKATSIDEVKHIRDTAKAASSCAKIIGHCDEIIIHAGVIKVRAERKLGQILMSTNLAKGGPGNQYTGKQVNRSHDATTSPRLKDLGLTKSDSSRAKTIASLPAPVFHRYVQQSIDSGQEPTTAGLLRLAKQQKVCDTIIRHADVPGFVCNLQSLIAEGRKFSTLYADPPWKYDNQGTRAATNNHYPTMTVEQIAAEPVAKLAADNSHLHLWTTNAFLPAAFSVIEAWGYEYKSCLVWVKPHLGIGNYYRLAHEFLLLGVRGSLPFCNHSQRSWIELERRGHSYKPEEIRAIIEQVSPSPYLELYGRTLLKNTAWTVHGNQLKPSKK